LTALIEAKREGKTFVEEEAPKRAPVIDMMEALKRSLHESEALKRKKPMLARPGTREREGRRRKSREFFLIHLS
jgi:non-homologous end joining protein Ku